MRVLVACLAVCCLLLASAHADLVCGSKFCQQNPCVSALSAAACTNPSTYRANHAGKCACCPACVTLLSKGATCKTYSKELGETPSAICREPLRCVANKCELILRN